MNNKLHIISFRIDEDAKHRLELRAIRHLISIPNYCREFIYKDLYRKRDNKPLELSHSATSEAQK